MLYFSIVVILSLIGCGGFALNAKEHRHADDSIEVTHMRSIYNKQSGAIRHETFTEWTSVDGLPTPSGQSHHGKIGVSQFKFKPLPSYEEWIVNGTFFKSLTSIGWHVLNMESNPNVDIDDETLAYEAGLMEGSLSALQIHQHLYNRYAAKPVPSNVLDFFVKQDEWLASQIEKHGKEDAFWRTAGILRKQVQGLMTGINKVKLPDFGPVNFTDVMLIVGMGDVFDLIPALNPKHRVNWEKMTKEEYDLWFATHTHCTGLVKITDNYDDLFFGHTSWYVYTAMMRVFKRLNLRFKSTAAHQMSFSSYPGMITSFDDFIVTDRNIFSLETSTSVLNSTVYNGNVRPDTVLYWMRNMIANYNSKTAKEWTQNFARYQSGTYNAQWLALDLNLFKPGQPLKPNTLWIAEEMPGLVKSRDVTDILSFGYFPSYNIPLDREIFERMGYVEPAKKSPDSNDYNLCSRANIFRRDSNKIKTLKDFQFVMLYNDYQHDPLSKGNPAFAIAARVDLMPKPRCFGNLDTKTSSWRQWMENSHSVLARSGPTPQQKDFNFETSGADCAKHLGLPNVYKFVFMNMSTTHVIPIPQ